MIFMPIDYKKKPVKPPCKKRTIIVSSGLLSCYNSGAVKRYKSATYVYQAIMAKSDVQIHAGSAITWHKIREDASLLCPKNPQINLANDKRCFTAYACPKRDSVYWTSDTSHWGTTLQHHHKQPYSSDMVLLMAPQSGWNP